MLNEKEGEREENRRKGNRSLSFTEKLSLFAAAAIVASYSRHSLIALYTGYPISLISAGPWDFVEGLLQSLPFILLSPIPLPDLIESYQDLVPRSKHQFTQSNAASLALLWFATLFVVSGFLFYLLLIQFEKANGSIWQVLSLVGLVLMLTPLLWPVVACAGRTHKWVKWLYSKDDRVRPFLRLTLSEESAVEWLCAIPIAIFILREFGLDGIRASLAVACAVLVFMAVLLLFKEKSNDNQSIDFMEHISDAQAKLRELDIWGRVAAVLVVATLVGGASFFSWSLNPKVAIDSEGTVYKLLDVFGGGSAVLSVAVTEQDDQSKTEPEQIEGVETNTGSSETPVDVEGADGNVVAKGEENARAKSGRAPGGYYLVDLKNGYRIEEESIAGEETSAAGAKKTAESVEPKQAGAPNEG